LAVAAEVGVAEALDRLVSCRLVTVCVFGQGTETLHWDRNRDRSIG